MTSDYLKERNKKINLVEIFKNWTLKSLGGGGAIQFKIATHILSLKDRKKIKHIGAICFIIFSYSLQN